MTPDDRLADLIDSLPDHRRWADGTADWTEVAAWQVARAAVAGGLPAAVARTGDDGKVVAIVDGWKVDYPSPQPDDPPQLTPADLSDVIVEPVHIGQLPVRVTVRSRLARLEARRS